jgi:predicted transcriptional regulator of viral defense system
MAPQTSEPWKLAARQHGVVSRRQLLDAGLSPEAIRHRVRAGRLHRAGRGVYAVGRPELSRYGSMIVAVLRCGSGAVVSHETAAELWGLRLPTAGPVEVSVPTPSPRRHPGVRVHNRRAFERDVRNQVPVTGVAQTLVDMAGHWSERHLEAAVNQADALDLMDPTRLGARWNGSTASPAYDPYVPSSTAAPSA